MSVNWRETFNEEPSPFPVHDENLNLSSRNISLVEGDEHILSVRDASGLINQIITFDYSNFLNLKFFLFLRSSFRALGFQFYIRVNLYRGYALYSCDCRNDNRQDLKEYAVGAWSSSITNISKPKVLRYDSDNQIILTKLNDGLQFNILGWNAYLVKSSFTIKSIDLIFQIPCDRITFNKDLKYNANYIDSLSILKDLSKDNIIVDKPVSNLYYYHSADKLTVPLILKKFIPAAIMNSVKDFEIEPVIEQRSEDLEDVTTTDDVNDQEKVIRIYDTVFVNFSKGKEVRIIGLVRPLMVKDFRNIFQLWFGNDGDILELIFDNNLDHGRSDFYRLYYKKGGRGKYRDDLAKTMENVESRGGFKYYDFGFKLMDNDIIEVKAFNKTLYSVKHKIPSRELEVGFEFQLTGPEMQSVDMKHLKRPSNYGKIVSIFIDGVQAAFETRKPFLKGYAANVQNLLANSLVDFSTAKKVTDFIIPKPEKPDVVIPEENKIVVPEEENVVSGLVGDGSRFQLSKNFVETRTSPLGLELEAEIFKKMKDYYTRAKLTPEDAELIIYQMGVSFCTSKSSVNDTSNFILWKDSEGRIRKFGKGIHSRLIQELSKSPCNVERTLLSSRSKEILELLRQKKLDWPFNHANKRGIMPEYAYLACDFLNLKKVSLSEGEKLAMTSQQMYARLVNKHKRAIVNVNQLL
uniref:Minor coat protein n=1 Tax=Strawberry pallidosis-associated virus TaxID=227507 RepID=A0A7G9U717_9CLOS|nr:minor coat protein [Strawberry pallidosis-associated virus]